MKYLTPNDLMSLEIRAANQGEQVVLCRDDFEALVRGYTGGKDRSAAEIKTAELLCRCENNVKALEMRLGAAEQNLKDAVSLRRNERKK